MRTPGVLILAVLSLAQAASGRTFLSQADALTAAFPKGARVERQTVYLTAAQVEAARRESGVQTESKLVVRYVGSINGVPAGYAYFDTHRVRTLPETVMIVVRPDGSIGRIDILSFDEPTDYLPKRRWLDQVHGQKLGSELSLDRSVRPITGASLSGRAIVDASRRVLGLHKVLSSSPTRVAGGSTGMK